MKRIFALLLSMVLVCSCSLSAMAAYVTDGTNLYVAGDANGDGYVDICDLVAANNSDAVIPAADLDGDDAKSGYDLALIRAMILGIDNSQWTE